MPRTAAGAGTVAQVLTGRVRPRRGTVRTMAGFLIRRTQGGRLSVRVAGCCGDPNRWRREYEQAFLHQTLADGGRLVGDGSEGVEVVDRRGRRHLLGPDVVVPAAAYPVSDGGRGGGSGGGCG